MQWNFAGMHREIRRGRLSLAIDPLIGSSKGLDADLPNMMSQAGYTTAVFHLCEMEPYIILLADDSNPDDESLWLKSEFPEGYKVSNFSIGDTKLENQFIQFDLSTSCITAPASAFNEVNKIFGHIRESVKDVLIPGTDHQYLVDCKKIDADSYPPHISATGIKVAAHVIHYVDGRKMCFFGIRIRKDKVNSWTLGSMLLLNSALTIDGETGNMKLAKAKCNAVKPKMALKNYFYSKKGLTDSGQKHFRDISAEDCNS